MSFDFIMQIKILREKKKKLYYMSMDSLLVYIKTYDIYKDMKEDAETRFDTSNYALHEPLSKEKNK